MRDTQLVIVEGIMGSGKSMLSKSIARQLSNHHFPSKHIPERFSSHPTSVTITLTHWQKIWIEHTPKTFIAQSLSNWQTFVTQATRSKRRIYVFDGQFFHGDMTGLFIANTPHTQMANYIDQLIQVIEPLQPVFIYLYQRDVKFGLQRTAGLRGQSFLRRQTAWKVDSPYCEARGYTGVEGFFQLYRDYRAFTDDLYVRLPIPKLSIENSAGEWAQYERRAFTFLGLP